MVKGKRTGQKNSPSKQWESIRPAECSSSGSDKKKVGNDSAVSTTEFPATSHTNLSMKQRSRRKMLPGSTQIKKGIKSPGETSNDQPNKYSTLQVGVLYLKLCNHIHCIFRAQLSLDLVIF